MPNTLKNSTKNGFASACSFKVFAHSFENCNARSFISFQLKVMFLGVIGRFTGAINLLIK